MAVPFNPANLDIDGLAESALRSFAVIERWSQPQQLSDHHLVVATVEKIMRQAYEYVRAIDMSLNTAQKGCEFADDAVELCNFMAKGDAPFEDLKRFLSEMLDKAEKAHAQALAINRQFSDVRSSLFQIAKNVPSDAKEIRREQLERNSKEGKQIANDIVRETATKSFDDIIVQLERAGDDLADLAGYVGNFVNWWNGMKIGIGSLRSCIPFIKPDGSNPMRQQAVLNRWERFREQYVQYQRQINLIIDFYPKRERQQEAQKQGAKRQEETQQEEQRLEVKRWEVALRLKPKLREEEQQEPKRLEEKRQVEKRRREPQRQEARQEATRQEEEQLEVRRQEVKHLEEEWLEAKRQEEEQLESRKQEAKRLEEEWLEVKRQEEGQLEARRLEANRLEEEWLKTKQQEEEQLEARRLEAQRLEEEWLKTKRQEEEQLLEGQLEEKRQKERRLAEERLEKERQEAEREEKRQQMTRTLAAEQEAKLLEEDKQEAKPLEEQWLEAKWLAVKWRLEEERLEKELVEVKSLVEKWGGKEKRLQEKWRREAERLKENRKGNNWVKNFGGNVNNSRRT